MTNVRDVSTGEEVDREAESIKSFIRSHKVPVRIEWGTVETMKKTAMPDVAAMVRELRDEYLAKLVEAVHGDDIGEMDRLYEAVRALTKAYWVAYEKREWR